MARITENLTDEMLVREGNELMLVMHTAEEDGAVGDGRVVQ